MVRTRAAVVTLAAFAVLALLPGTVYGQSRITGVVKDATGAVIPGVTVEAASPALIEKVRTVVTDGAGQFQIVDLRPGSYTVTFSLAGFGTVKREGIELPSDFTATVNTEMRAGASEETSAVSGQVSMVDTSSGHREQVLGRQLLDSVPSGRSTWAHGATVPSLITAAPDVGGSRGTQYLAVTTHGSYHADNLQEVDGLNMKPLESDGTWTMYHDTGIFEEIVYRTTGSNAEYAGPGGGMNQIPKDGGNVVRGQVFASYVPGDWGSDNVTPELKARGLRAGARIRRTFDFNPNVGGPIMRNRLWFFTSYRYWGSDTYVNNSFYNLDPTHRTYQPDVSRQVIDDNLLKAITLRLTWQVAQKHKFASYFEHIDKFRGHECSSLYAAEACGVRYPKTYYDGDAKYTGTLSSRLLVEAGFAINNWTWSNGERQRDVEDTDIPRFDRSLLTRWSARDGTERLWTAPRLVLGGSVSYVTGSHALKGGLFYDWGTSDNWIRLGRTGVVDLIQEYVNGVPSSVVVYNTPLFFSNRLNYEVSAYVQDSWKIRRLTVSPGIRLQWIHSEIRPQVSGAGRFVPAREFAREQNMPKWGPDPAPRLGVAYDLFGDGRTALKANVGKYVRAQALGFASTYNPMRQATDRRNWRDLNGDDIAQDDEIGRVNVPFDIVGVRTRNPDPDIKRSYQWELSAGIQHQLLTRVSVTANWTYRTFRRLMWMENLAAGQSDYTRIDIQNPLDPSETIPVYNLDRAKLGLVNYVDRNSDKIKRINNGFDFGTTVRAGGGNILVGVSLDRQIRVACETSDPNTLRFCDQSEFGMPYRSQFKISGMYPLPLGIEFSGSFQSNAGGFMRVDDGLQWQQVSYNVTRAVLPTLVQSSVTRPLIQPGTKYLPRWNQADVRIARRFDVGRMRLRAQFDMYNATNTSSIMDLGQVYGPNLDRVNEIIPGRVYGFSTRLDF